MDLQLRTNPAPGAWATDFSYDFYVGLLEQASKGASVCPLGAHATNPPRDSERRLYIRHDIDVCLDAALAMARRESEAGFAATFMFIPNAIMYDLGASEAQSILREIAGLGHEVALHFDVVETGVDLDAPDADGRLERAIDEQCNLISDIVGAPVHSVSFHRPLPRFLRGPTFIGERINGYAAELMGFYVSDSQGNWRQGDPRKDVAAFTDSERRPSFGQILTHPIWWGDTSLGAEARIRAFFKDRAGTLNEEEQAALIAKLAATAHDGITVA